MKRHGAVNEIIRENKLIFSIWHAIYQRLYFLIFSGIGSSFIYEIQCIELTVAVDGLSQFILLS